MKVSAVVGYVVGHIFFIDGHVRHLVIWLVMWKIYMHMATILIAVLLLTTPHIHGFAHNTWLE